MENGDELRVRKLMFLRVSRPTDEGLDELRRVGCKTNHSARIRGVVCKVVVIPKDICSGLLLETLNRVLTDDLVAAGANEARGADANDDAPVYVPVVNPDALVGPANEADGDLYNGIVQEPNADDAARVADANDDAPVYGPVVNPYALVGPANEADGDLYNGVVQEPNADDADVVTRADDPVIAMHPVALVQEPATDATDRNRGNNHAYAENHPMQDPFVPVREPDTFVEVQGAKDDNPIGNEISDSHTARGHGRGHGRRCMRLRSSKQTE